MKMLSGYSGNKTRSAASSNKKWNVMSLLESNQSEGKLSKKLLSEDAIWLEW
jgi:hypothetical protein